MDFTSEDRGVTPILGAVLLAGIAVMAMTVWQVQVIPIENENAEFQHYQGVGDDMQELRSAWVNTAGSGETKSNTIQLGFEYPQRTIFISPPAATGTLEIAHGGPMEASGFNVSSTCGLPPPMNSSYIKYTPHYAELSQPPYILEYGLVYRNVSGEPILESEQLLVDGKTINLYGLLGESSTTSRERESVDFYGANIVGINSSQAGQVWLNLSTQSPDAWEKALADVDNVNQTLVSNGMIHIQMKPGDYDVRCPLTGTGSTPEPDPDEVEGGLDEINPEKPGEVQFVSATVPQGQNSWVDVNLNNTGDTEVNITEARISFYHDASGATGKDAVEYANLTEPPDTEILGTVYVRGSAAELHPQIRLTTSSPSQTVRLKFYNGKDNKFGVQASDWFVIYLYFDSGEQGLYFMSPTE